MQIPGRFSLLAAAFWVLAVQHAAAQFQTTETGPGEVQRWRIGMVVAAGGGCRQVAGNVAVPDTWPEQDVRIVAHDVSPGVELDYDTIAGAVKQMLVKIDELPRGAEARALVTFEVRRRMQIPPAVTTGFAVPDARRLDRKLRVNLAPSPLIESTHPKIKALAQELGGEEMPAWDRVEAIYDAVRERIPYRADVPLMGAVETLDAGAGDCNGLTSLFIAVCRAQGIPARTVRVPGHCYPEFYLEDQERRGRWFPCQASGTRAFGGMPDLRPILQKGDNLPVRDAKLRRTVHERFLPETLVALPVVAADPPTVRLVCEKVQ